MVGNVFDIFDDIINFPYEKATDYCTLMITLAGNRKIKLGAKVLDFLSKMKAIHNREEQPILTILLKNFNQIMQRRVDGF